MSRVLVTDRSGECAGNISFEPVDDSSARVTLTDHGRTASGPETWSTPITGYGEFEGLRLPARGKAAYRLPDGDLEYIDVTVTDLHYDTEAAGPEERA